MARYDTDISQIIEDLSDMVYESLGKYYSKEKRLPSNILFYRDGVSESQYEAVTEYEVPRIRKGYVMAQERMFAVNPKMQRVDVRIHFVIAQKRHHVRFYASHESQCAVRKKDGNVRPGLLVDTDVTRPGEPNFYLQPHAALQGTARPTHYVILHAEIPSLTIDEVVDITHAFCYNYARATKGVSYCGPAYYADRLCDRGYHYLRRLYFDHNNRPVPALAQGSMEPDPQFFMRMKAHVENHAYWNVNGRKNPWHSNMDHRMFYL